ncbi:hypothetical protein PAMA_007641 [Pampus argenteus]
MSLCHLSTLIYPDTSRSSPSSSSTSSLHLFPLIRPRGLLILGTGDYVSIVGAVEGQLRLYKTSQRFRRSDLKSAGWIQGPVADTAGTELTIDDNQRSSTGAKRPMDIPEDAAASPSSSSTKHADSLQDTVL